MCVSYDRPFKAQALASISSGDYNPKIPTSSLTDAADFSSASRESCHSACPECFGEGNPAAPLR